MTRKSKLTRSAVTLALLAVFATADALLADHKPNHPGGGGGGDSEPAPAGTIYFEQNADYPLRETLGMNSDGSVKFFALPAQNEDEIYVGDPSSGLYDERPIWLVAVNLAELYPGHNELFAVRATTDGTDIEAVQITEINPDFTIDFSGARWSNDGQDSFISWAGFDHRLRLSGAGDAQKGLFRLPVSGVELALAFSDPALWTPFGPGNVETVLLDEDLSTYSQHHDWSPDGSKVAYILNPLNEPSELHVWDVGAETDSLLLSGSTQPRWSPDGSRIAVSGRIQVRNKTKLGIITVNPDGSDTKLILEDKSNVSYWEPHWSLDSGHMAILVRELVKVNGSNELNYHIARIKADGSALTILTEDLDPFDGKRMLGWR